MGDSADDAEAKAFELGYTGNPSRPGLSNDSEIADDQEKFVTTHPNGSASGSVWHTHRQCAVGRRAPDSRFWRKVTDEEISLLGFGQCRACLRLDLLKADEILLHIASALYKIGISRMPATHVETLNMAKNLMDVMVANGVQFVGRDSDG